MLPPGARACSPAIGIYCELGSIFASLLVLALLAGRAAAADTEDALQLAFDRLYNSDFDGARRVLDARREVDPQNPLLLTTTAAAGLYSELDRLKILQLDFFTDDDKLIDRRKLVPDPRVRQSFLNALAEADRISQARLAAKPDDREALFAMCMSSGLTMDYAALVERRRFGTIPLARRTQGYAARLLALHPPVYDAYMTYGMIEYVVGSIPFIFRWLIHFDQIKGDKKTGIDELQQVADHGQYYGPMARIMLAVIHMREKRLEPARKLLAGLVAQFPENPLFRRELARVEKDLARRRSR